MLGAWRLGRCSAAPALGGRRGCGVRLTVRAASGASAAAARSGGTAEDVMQLIGTRKSVPFTEVVAQLNVSEAELTAAVERLEAEGHICRHRRRGKWDVLINDPHAVVQKVLGQQTPDALKVELETLRVELASQRTELRDLQKLKDQLDGIAKRHPNTFASAGLAGMTGLWCLLFWMVFAESVFGCETFAFDWNLVEPITYFLGYTMVWFGVVFYYFTGQEYTYDTVRDMLEARKRERLYIKHAFDLNAFNALSDAVEAGERREAELHDLLASNDPKAASA